MLQAQEQLTVGRASFLSGLTSAQWPARFQRLADGPLTNGIETWLDGAHNVEAARALGALLADHGPKHIVLGILANKDASAIVADDLLPQCAQVWALDADAFVVRPGPRLVDGVETIAAILHPHRAGPVKPTAALRIA